MRKQNLAIVATGLLVAGRALAGNLDPTNAPGPTMHTLEEIYQKANNLVVYANVTAAVPQTGQTNAYQTGDDGTYQKGVTLPNPRFTIQTDANCVLDNLTGLIWARNANLVGTMDWSSAIVYCESLNYGGQTDWRLPNRRELLSLVDDSRFSPSLPTGHPFAGVQNYFYWSGTSFAPITDNAWYVNLDGGNVGLNNKTVNSFVWPVRGGQ